MSELSQKILKEIERRNLAPRPAAHFLARRAVFWALTILSVLLGALAAAFLIFYAADWITTGGKAFDEMPFDDVAPYLPALALVSFVVLMASATLTFAKTRRGYLHRTSVIAGAAFLVSSVLGLGLHLAGTGGALDRVLKDNFESYRDYTTIPYEEWSHPEAGKLGGAAIDEDGPLLFLRDFKGKQWAVDTAGAVKSFDGTAVEEGDVAITGAQTGPAQFKANKIDPFD